MSSELGIITLGMLKDLSNYHDITFRLHIKPTYLSFELIKKLSDGELKKKKYTFTNTNLGNLTLQKIMSMVNDINHMNM